MKIKSLEIKSLYGRTFLDTIVPNKNTTLVIKDYMYIDITQGCVHQQYNIQLTVSACSCTLGSVCLTLLITEPMA